MEKYASLLESEQNKAWRKKRGTSTEIASRRFVRLCQEILEFEFIQNDVNNLLFPDLRDSEQLELNALFQQANVGDNKPWNPKYFPTVSKEVWTAWSSKSGKYLDYD
jgi:acyl-CoA-binding protein